MAFSVCTTLVVLRFQPDRPRSRYQYSNMAPTLSGQTSTFGVVVVVVVFLYPSLFRELRDKRNFKKLQ